MIALVMIVRNEAAIIRRCLNSVVPYIDHWVITDTGSTDDTPKLVKEFFTEFNIPGTLHHILFENFEQARNASLAYAKDALQDSDYLLLCDADMELVVSDPNGFKDLTAPGYSFLQRTIGNSYWNWRLVRKDAALHYVGVTHEYLAVTTPEEPAKFQTAWFIDHVDGHNRPAKFDRDIKLLETACHAQPNDARSRYYLAQSYRDAGNPHAALRVYHERAEMAGWDEEAWHARLQEARLHLSLGDGQQFVACALAAFQQRPGRMEPLYDLSRYYRGLGNYELSLLFAEAGLMRSRPTEDVLFIEEHVYQYGLLEEFSIAAFYANNPATKNRGQRTCESLALNPWIPMNNRLLARQNLHYYAQPLSELLPSFKTQPIEFAVPDGWHATNPSIAQCDNDLLVLQRVVNYEIREDGSYETHNQPIITRNFLLSLRNDLTTAIVEELEGPVNIARVYHEVIGLEDARLLMWQNKMWCIGTVRHSNPEGSCEQVLSQIEGAKIICWQRMPRFQQHEKNWMPVVNGDELQFIHHCFPVTIVDSTGTLSQLKPASLMTDDFRGGTQLVPYDKGWLALIHEVVAINGLRYYHHRFVQFNQDLALHCVTQSFTFANQRIEFAAGMVLQDDKLVISYGANDSSSWLATVLLSEVEWMLEHGQTTINR